MQNDIYYSQHGEDFLLNKIFNEKPRGYFVEVGCLDGIEYSNTYFFEKKGWKGMCIEAHNDFIKDLRLNRPHSTVVHCAVGEADKESVVFYANKAGSLSTLDKNEEDRWKRNYADDFHGFEEQNVSMRTLTSVFDEMHLADIDFVSLDIEGYEVKALSGLDFLKYKPKVFVIEYKDETHKEQLEEILLPNGYHFLSQIGCNLFYGLDISGKAVLEGHHGRIKLLQVDSAGINRYREIVLAKPTFVERVKSALLKTPLGKIWNFLRSPKTSK
jgi:FkbM family methyltransferase